MIQSLTDSPSSKIDTSWCHNDKQRAVLSFLHRHPHCCQCKLGVHPYMHNLSHRANPLHKEVTFHQLHPRQGDRHCWKFTTLIWGAIETLWETSNATNTDHPHILPTAAAQNCTEINSPTGIWVEDNDSHPIQNQQLIQEKIKINHFFLPNSIIPTSRSNHEKCGAAFFASRYPHCCQYELRVHSHAHPQSQSNDLNKMLGEK